MCESAKKANLKNCIYMSNNNNNIENKTVRKSKVYKIDIKCH